MNFKLEREKFKEILDYVTQMQVNLMVLPNGISRKADKT